MLKEQKGYISEKVFGIARAGRRIKKFKRRNLHLLEVSYKGQAPVVTVISS